jgi:uncharacterized protein (TIGR02145 family)
MKATGYFNKGQIPIIFFFSFIFFTSLLKAQTVIIDIKTFLEGPYNSGVMTTTLNEQLPLSQPFTGAPWSYSGTESVTSIPAEVADWVMLELRDKDDNTQIVKKQAAFILNSGHVVDLDGVSPVSFVVENNDYYVAINHRNHLSVLSSTIAYSSTCPGTPTVNYGGKIYNTVQIGTQCWLRENLDFDGDGFTKTCYDDDPSNCAKYGGLYDWFDATQFATTEGAQGICPNGWHIPTLLEFQTLQTTVGDSGPALIAIDQGIGTNTSGFSALLGGFVSAAGAFMFLDRSTRFWSSSRQSPTFNGAYLMELWDNRSNINLTQAFLTDESYVRCIKD